MSRSKARPKLCIPCSDVINCLKFNSPDNTIKIIKRGDTYEFTTNRTDGYTPIMTFYTTGSDEKYQDFPVLEHATLVAIGMADQLYLNDKFEQSGSFVIWTDPYTTFTGTVLLIYRQLPT